MGEVRATSVCAAGAGLAILGMFTIWHWIRIAPVPAVFVEGLVHVVIVSAALTWALTELRRAGRFRAGPLRGLAFGLLMWSPLPLYVMEGWFVGPQGPTTASPRLEDLPWLVTLASTGLPVGVALGAALGRSARAAAALGVFQLTLHLFLGGFAMYTGAAPISVELVSLLLPTYLLAGAFILHGSELLGRQRAG